MKFKQTGSRDTLAELFEGTEGVCDPVKESDTDCYHQRCEFRCAGVPTASVGVLYPSLSDLAFHRLFDEKESTYDRKIV